jgi:hypothetical protein
MRQNDDDSATVIPSTEGTMRSFDFNQSYSEELGPRMHLPLGTALLGSLFAANMAAAVLSLFTMS